MNEKRSIEQRLVRAILGRERASALMVDAYMNRMAQTGSPLRIETFFMAFRREGRWFNPFDLVRVLNLLRPELPDSDERAFLCDDNRDDTVGEARWDYSLTPAMEKALTLPFAVQAVPKGAWFVGGEVLMAPTGASYMVGWLETLGLMLHYPIQISTAILDGDRKFDVTCEDEAEIVRICAEAVGIDPDKLKIRVRTREYRENVFRAAQRVVEALGGDAHRAFEVGLRSSTCMQQMGIALEEIKKAGVMATSDMFHAMELGMIPVGTTGHNHQKRHGADDLDGYRAVRDGSPFPPSYLFDTYDPILLGIAAAIVAMLETPDRKCSVRFDSGDQDEQFRVLLAATLYYQLMPGFIFEDSYNDEKTRVNEAFLRSWSFPLERAFYGYGGYWIARTAFSPYTRDKVSAGWKLCQTGDRDVMKWSASPGKESNPGRLVSYIRNPEVGTLTFYKGCERLNGQEGEEVDGFVPTDSALGRALASKEPTTTRVGVSPQTRRMMTAHRQDLEQRQAEARAFRGHAEVMRNIQTIDVSASAPA
jgi:nicotinate phosphoribosyltransferase